MRRLILPATLILTAALFAGTLALIGVESPEQSKATEPGSARATPPARVRSAARGALRARVVSPATALERVRPIIDPDNMADEAPAATRLDDADFLIRREALIERNLVRLTDAIERAEAAGNTKQADALRTRAARIRELSTQQTG